MIKVISTRHKAHMEPHVCTFMSNKDSALKDLVTNELGFGGRVTDANPDKVVTNTVVMAARDEVQFTGPQDEMEMLYKVAVAHVTLMHHGRDKLVNSMIDPIMAATHGNPLLVTHMAPMFLGSRSVALALFMAYEEMDTDLILELVNMDLKELVALLQMAKSEKRRLRSVCKDLGVVTV